MRCPRCGFDGLSSMRFCSQCGTPLALVAPSPEERKLVTVLFADVVGSTQLSGVLDPEHVQAQMERFFTIARDEVHRHGGTVEKYIGDAVMAIFGLPVVHEDDPERAARAAVALAARVRTDREAGLLPAIRIGITTGEVVITTQSAGTGERLVTGEAVNLAARLQQHAAPGQILVAEHVRRAVRSVAKLRSLPPLAVKGYATPLPAWQLVAVGRPREREVRPTPFVGRRDELAMLAGYVREMQREGRGHAVTVLGPAGVGKTRLVRELRSRVGGVRILRGRALPYGTGVPFWQLSEAIREECGILFGDPQEVVRSKLQDAAARLDVADAVPAFLTVLGLGEGAPEPSREVLFARMWTFFEALARRAPLLLIAEDTHSAEDATLDYIEYSAGRLSDVPLLLLVLSRPELLERRPAWMGGRRSATTLFLEPLGERESGDLVRGILEDRPAPQAFLDLVLERAEGNPLFIEEILRTLREQGVLVDEGARWALSIPLDPDVIPDSVQAVITARIDALPAPEKQTLEAAAVVGKDFWLGALRVLAGPHPVDDAIQALISKGVLIPKPRSTLLNEQEFAFRHILIRDVAYRMLPKTQRWPKHVRFAEWLHQIAGDRQAEYADIIAHHWVQVGLLRDDVGLPPDPHARAQAITHLLVAAARASRLYANTTALDHYGRALELEPAPEQRLPALLGRGEVWMLLGQLERAREDFGSVHVLAQEVRERRWQILALDRLGHSYRRQDQIAQALDHLQQALALSRRLQDPSLTGHILNHIGFTYFSAAKYEDAIQAHLEARGLLEPHGDLAGLAESLHGLGDTAVLLGRFEEGTRWLSESADLCDQIGDRSLAGENRYVIALCRDVLGDAAAAQIEVERSVAVLAEIGDTWRLSFALSAAARVAVPLGAFGRAIECVTRGLSLAGEIGAGRAAIFNLLCLSMVRRELEDAQGAWQAGQEAADLLGAGEVGGFWRPSVLASLAVDAATLGRTDDAHGYVREARRAAVEGPTRGDFPEEVAHAEGRVLLAAGRPADARVAAQELADLVSTAGHRRWWVPALLLQADCAAGLGDAEGAATLYDRAVEEAGRLGRLPGLWRALAGLAEAQLAMNLSEPAAASARRAREIIDRLAATIPDEGLRETFLQSARVRRIAALADTFKKSPRITPGEGDPNARPPSS